MNLHVVICAEDGCMEVQNVTNYLESKSDARMVTDHTRVLKVSNRLINFGHGWFLP